MTLQPRRPLLVTLAVTVFLANVVISAILFALTSDWAAPMPATLGMLALVAALLGLQLWTASALRRGSRQGWFVGIVFAVIMLLPLGWDATMAAPNLVYMIISTGAFAVVLIALWHERNWFKHESLESAHPV